MTDEMENLKRAGSETVSPPARKGLRVIIAILVLSAPIGLFLVIGAVTGRSGGEASRYEDQAVQVERRLIISPQDPELLLELADAHFRAAQEMIKGGSRQASEEVIRQYRLATQAWSKYLEVASEPNISAAKVTASAFVSLAEAAPDVAEYREQMRKAAQASEVVAKQAPSVDALMTLTYYRDFAFDWQAAARAATEALALARTRPDFGKVRNALNEYRQIARETNKQMTEG